MEALINLSCESLSLYDFHLYGIVGIWHLLLHTIFTFFSYYHEKIYWANVTAEEAMAQ